MARAARWDGFVPIHRARPGGVASPDDIAAVRDRIGVLRGSAEGFDLAVWGTLDADGQLAEVLPDYAAVGATWWLESVKPEPGWLEAVRARLHEVRP